MKPAEQKFAAAMRGSRYDARNTPPGKASAEIVPIRKGELHLGDVESGDPLGINLKKLMEGRLLIQASSGAGKSWTLRRLMEQSAGLVQQILIDPEGEFKSLAKEFELVVIDATRFDAAAMATAASRAREHRLSLLLDLSDVDYESQMKLFASFVIALVAAPKQHWHPCLVVIDEAHLFAPFGGQGAEATSVRKAAIAALVDLMSRGRKRGLAGAIATLRLARLSKSVASPVQNFLIGNNTLDLDIRRAAEQLGWDARRAFDALPGLTPGEFVAVGPAFSHRARVAKVGPVVTHHSGASPEMNRPEQHDTATAEQLLDLDALAAQSEDDARTLDEARLPAGLKAVRAMIRDPSFRDAGAVWSAIRPLYPDGASLVDLKAHLKLNDAELAGAVALLEMYGGAEIFERDDIRAARVTRWMVP